MDKLIISVTANEGAMRDANRHVPWTPAEIAADAARCRAAGAALIHYHCRTAEGGMDHSAAAYGEAIAGIRARCDILQIPSLANQPGATVADRLANILPGLYDARTRPDFVAVEPGSTNMDLYDPQRRVLASKGRTFINGFDTVETLLAAIRGHGLRPFFASFNVGWTRAVEALLEMEAVTPPVLLMLVLGGPSFIAAHPATPAGLQAHLQFLPALRVHWMTCCHGASALDIAAMAIEQGGHLALGLGDHPYAELGEPTNAELVERIVHMARERGREIAQPADVLAMVQP